MAKQIFEDKFSKSTPNIYGQTLAQCLFGQTPHTERGSPNRKADLVMYNYGPYLMLDGLNYGPYPMRKCVSTLFMCNYLMFKVFLKNTYEIPHPCHIVLA
uniref:Putative ovule protein n=1 Tax=Solanum chacoense TaxID=4108 RepID=A0A0V0HK31_SOLCH